MTLCHCCTFRKILMYNESINSFYGPFLLNYDMWSPYNLYFGGPTCHNLKEKVHKISLWTYCTEVFLVPFSVLVTPSDMCFFLTSRECRHMGSTIWITMSVVLVRFIRNVQVQTCLFFTLTPYQTHTKKRNMYPHHFTFKA